MLEPIKSVLSAVPPLYPMVFDLLIEAD